MSAVASSLGYTTMSLYRYVTSKDELLVLMVDVASAISIPAEDGDDTDWRHGMRAWVQACMQAFREHPWLIDLPVSGAPVTPNSLLAVDWMLRIMRPLAVSDGEKISTLLLLTSLARAFGTFERDLTASSGGGQDVAALSEALKELVTAEEFPDLYPLIQQGLYVSAGADEPEVVSDLDFSLERVFDGLQHRVDTGPTPTAQPRPEEERLDAAILADKGVREAARERREVEKKLREARKREREAMKRVRERLRH
jgi:AcrR family transcriptional regulator